MERQIRDFITIGSKIDSISKLNIIEKNDNFLETYEQWGKDYTKFSQDYHSFLNEHLISKYLVSNQCFYNVLLINFLIKNTYFQKKTIISNNINIGFLKNIEAQCTLKIFHNVSPNYFTELPIKYGDYIYEISEDYKTFVVLDNLVSFKKDSGKKLIKKIQEIISCPIVLQAGFLNFGDYVDYYENKNLSIIENLVKYYENLNFKNMNDKFGAYNEAVIMLYLPN